jgi:hypothetical protein
VRNRTVCWVLSPLGYGNQNKSPLSPHIGNNCHLEALTHRVRECLAIASSYTAFEIELEPLLPNEKTYREERAKSIHAFAGENGWSATILDPGIRVTFRKLAT